VPDPSRIATSTPVRVFKNLKYGCFSIMQGGRIRASAKEVRLADVEFRVRTSGRERMLREQRRNVHAYAVGRLLDYVHPDEDRSLGPLGGRRAVYHPYRFPTFVDGETTVPVLRASLVQLDASGLSYLAEPTGPELPLLDAA
jgi:hypothetical protein